jgi:peptidoglycan hydrolase FlgJ
MSPVTPSAGPAAAVAAGTKDSPERVLDAARQFEALLVGQMLRSMRESGSGWLGTGADGAGSIATEFAEQQFAAALSAQGGLGLAGLIAAGLDRER